MRLLNDEEIRGKYNGYGWRNPARLEMVKLRAMAKAQHQLDLKEFIKELEKVGDTQVVEVLIESLKQLAE